MTTYQTIEQDQNCVGPEFACPRCGERRADYLVLLDPLAVGPITVKCATCFRETRLPEPKS